jgi:uncharacterized iron-regulated protein
MNDRYFGWLLRWSVSMVLVGLLATPACGMFAASETISGQLVIQRPSSDQTLPMQEVLSDLAQANVVYLGESHDSPEDHAAQLEIIQALHQQNPNLAIGLEMFQRPFQPVIDQYLAGEIDEAQLRDRTEYEDRWGFPWEYYAPILRYAQAHQLPVLALNVPTEVTRQVAAKGLEGLSEGDRQYIPPFEEIDTSNTDYQQFLLRIYKNFHQGHGSSTGFERFFLAQVLWDETMAAGVADLLTDEPETQVVVLAGQGHVVYGYGIPSRVERRLNAAAQGETGWNQRIVLLNPHQELDLEANRDAIADYLWYTHSSVEN